MRVITKVHCPVCGRCLAMRYLKNKKAVTRTLCNKPIIEKENEMLETLKCVKCRSLIYVTYEVKPAL